MQCTAKAKQSGVQCKNEAINGTTKCRMHGGASLRGIAHPNYQGKGVSKYIPTRLLERYNEAMADSELLSVRKEIALLDARLADLLGRVDTGEAGKLWQTARAAYRDLSVAFNTKNADRIYTAMDTLDNVLGKGASDYAAWSEVQTIIEQRRRLAESERKRLVEMEQIITSEQAMVLVGALLTSVREHVKDRRSLTAIQTEFIRLMSTQPKVVTDGRE